MFHAANVNIQPRNIGFLFFFLRNNILVSDGLLKQTDGAGIKPTSVAKNVLNVTVVLSELIVHYDLQNAKDRSNPTKNWWWNAQKVKGGENASYI